MTADQLSCEEQKILAFVKSGSAFQLLQLLAQKDQDIKEHIQGKSFALGLSVPGGMKRKLLIKNDKIEPEDGSLKGTGIVFRFPEYNELNHLLGGQKAQMLPVFKSFRAFDIIKSFKLLTARIPVYLNPEDDFLKTNFDFITRLLMGAALRGIKEVAENDPYVADRVNSIPDGIISLQVEGKPELETRIEKKGKCFTIKIEPDTSRPNAVLIFNNSETAYQLFKGQINAIVALGTSDVKIRGKIPMIQGLFPILDRLSYYMSIE